MSIIIVEKKRYKTGSGRVNPSDQQLGVEFLRITKKIGSQLLAVGWKVLNEDADGWKFQS